MRVRPFVSADLPAVMALWNACVDAGEALYYPLTEAYFRRKFLEGEGCEPALLLVAEDAGGAVGFIHGVAPERFRGGRPGNAYLTVLMVAAAHRGKGVGAALLSELEARLRVRGATTLFISSVNPVNLDWRIPGTPGHDHNNMPGLDDGCAGRGFFPAQGFVERHHEVAMYIDLARYRMPPGIAALREQLAAEGVATGVYDPALNCGFDAMCDRVGSDYWRDALRTEIAAHREGRPNDDPRFWPDGVRPAGPRPILAAVYGDRIVGFTGPVDRQRSGRGWFTGICTDPEFGGRGIATVLFNLLMEAFVARGAAFSTLFTGTENHAQRIYRNAGMEVVRAFTLMSKPLA